MDDKIIVYRSFYSPIEASIIKSRLDDSGFSCFLSDENIATINPLYNQAVGGVKLHVFEKDVEAIHQLLEEEPALAQELTEDESAAVCPECHSNHVGYVQATQNRFSWWTMIVSVLLMVYPFKANKCYHCYNCGHEFK